MGIFISSSSSGPASATLYHTNCWVVEFHPRTAAIRSLDSVPLYVSFAASFSPSSPSSLYGVTLSPHPTTPHSTGFLHLTPPLCPDQSPSTSPTPALTPKPSLPLPPFSSPPPSRCQPAPTTDKTPSLPSTKWTAHRVLELVASQCITRPYSVSL